MIRKYRWMCVVATLFLLAGTAAAQFQFQVPRARGVWNPVVGSGAVYQVENKGDKKSEMEFAIVGTETFEGKTGHWMETTFDMGEGPAVTKTLVVLEGNGMGVKRMIMQMPGHPPMEMPVEMMGRGRGQGPAEPQSADVRKEAEIVGTETITTPAGTFECQHFRSRDKTTDIWVSEKVAPYGMVKMTSKDSNMTLLRVLTNAKTKIKGTPQKFDPMEMMRRQQPN